MGNEFLFLLPLWIVLIGSLLLLTVEMFSTRENKLRNILPFLSGLLLFLAILAEVYLYSKHGEFRNAILLFQMTVKIDLVSHIFTLGVLLSGFLAVLFSEQYLKEHRATTGEYYALLFVAVAGMINLIIAGEFLTFFVALELVSISGYILASYIRTRDISIEAALKYYLPGVFSTGFILMGIAIIYGVTGTTFFEDIKYLLPAKTKLLPLFFLGLLFLLAGIGFKIAFVPFHAYAPDVYEGSSAPVSGFLATGVKVATFAVFLRIFGDAFLFQGDWLQILPAIAIFTMFFGNIMAFLQNSIKRMLAYSSIAHAGYVLIGIVTLQKAETHDVGFAVGFYMLAYTLMTSGAFGVLGYLSRESEKYVTYDDLAGIAKSHPWLAAVMAIFMFSLIGFPPSAGFFAKYYIFRLALQEGYVILVIIGILNSFLSAYYYLKVIVYMFMKREEEVELTPLYSTMKLGILVSSAGVVILGFLPLFY